MWYATVASCAMQTHFVDAISKMAYVVEICSVYERIINNENIA